MSTEAVPVTRNAITKRFQKLKALAAEESVEGGDAATPKTKAILEKRKTADDEATLSKKAKATSKPKPKFKAKEIGSESGEAGVEGESPTKKAKSTPKWKAKGKEMGSGSESVEKEGEEE